MPHMARSFSATIVACAAGCMLMLPAAAQQVDKASAPPARDGADLSGVVIERDPATLITRVTIAAKQGEVPWSAVLDAVARAKGYDTSTFSNIFDGKSLRLDSTRSRIEVAAINVLLPRGIAFVILPPPAGAVEPLLEITLDRAAILASKRRFQNMLRAALADRLARGRAKPEYGLHWDTNPDDTRAAGEAVVVVHGFHFAPEQHSSLADDIAALNVPVASFRYPGDQPVEDSAKLLSRTLKQLAVDRPRQKIRLVALSMGGLVARRAIEDPALDPGNVIQLVMVATPNHGSQLAYFGFALEVWQFVVDAQARGITQRLYETVEDGLGEAADDLQPDSLLVQDLNARQRNPRVRYALFLGTGAKFNEESLTDIRKQLAAAGDKNRFVRFFGPKLDHLLGDSDELVRGRGDGLVSIARGKLDGVSDTMTLDFDHTAIIGQPVTDAERSLRAGILERVKQPAP